jgi:putative transposase
MINAIAALAPVDGITKAACLALGLSRATVQRRRAIQAKPPMPRRPRPRPPRALSAMQQQTVLDLLHEPRFADQAPAEIFATLLDQDTYHCLIRTMYRILGRNTEVRERRAQLRHPAYQKPELLAERPNEVWTWDITKLMGHAKWSYFYLYVIIDIFSRRVVGGAAQGSACIARGIAAEVGASPMPKPPACSARCSMRLSPNTKYPPANSLCTPIAGGQ